jgi:hypothetical protein
MVLAGLFPVAILLVLLWYVKGELAERRGPLAEPGVGRAVVRLLPGGPADGGVRRLAGTDLHATGVPMDFRQEVA